MTPRDPAGIDPIAVTFSPTWFHRNCGMDFSAPAWDDPVRRIDVYQELNPTSLDIGGGSNYHAIRRAFPDIPFSLIVNAPDIKGRTSAEVDDLVAGMVEGASPVDKISVLWVAEVSDQIDDETIRAVRTSHERI